MIEPWAPDLVWDKISHYIWSSQITQVHQELKQHFAHEVHWIEDFGHQLIKEVDDLNIIVPGETMDSKYGEWLKIWHELDQSN